MATKKTSSVELMTSMIQRRDNALAELAKHTVAGNVGQQVYWHTIAVDAGLLLSMISGDQYWEMIARQDARGLQAAVDALDTSGKEYVTPTPFRPQKVAA